MRKLILLMLTAVFMCGSSYIADASSWAWNTWREGFEDFENAEKAALEGKNEEALDLFRKSLASFQAIQKKNPDWNVEVIKNRVKLCKRRIDRVKEKMSPTAKNDTPQEDGANLLPSGEQKNENPAYASDAVRKELDDYKSKYYKLMIELEDNRRLLQRNGEAAENLKNVMKEKYDLDREMIALKQQLAAAKQNRETPDSELGEIRKQLISQKIKYDELHREHKTVVAELEQLKLDKSKLLQTGTTEKYTIKLKDEKIATLEDNLKRIQLNVRNTDKEREKLASDLEGLQKEKKHLQESFDKKYQAYEELFKKYQEIREKNSSGDISKQLMTENNTYRTRIAELEKQLNAINDRTGDWEKKLRTSESQRQTLENTLLALKKTKIADENDLKNLTDKCQESNRVADDRQKQIEVLQQKISATENELKLFAGKYNDLIKKARAFETDVQTGNSESTKTVNALNAELKKAKSEYGEQIAKLNAQIKEEIEGRQKLHDLLKKTEKDIIASRKDREALDKLKLEYDKMLKVKDDFDKLSFEHQKLTAIKDGCEKQISELTEKAKKNNTDTTGQINQLNYQLREATDSLKSVKAKLATAEGQMAPLMKLKIDYDKLTTKYYELAKIKKQYDLLLAEHDNLIVMKGEYEKIKLIPEEHEQLKKKFETANAECKKAVEERDDLKKRLETLSAGHNSGIVALRKQLEDAKSKNLENESSVIKSYRAEIDRLKEKLSDTEQKLSQANIAVDAARKNAERAMTEKLKEAEKAMPKPQPAVQTAQPVTPVAKTIAPIVPAPAPTTTAVVTPLPAVKHEDAGNATPERLKTVVFLLQAALNSEGQNDFESALWHYRKIISIVPDNFTANLRIGEILLQSGKIDEAEKYLQSAINSNRNSPEALYGMVRIAINRGQLPEADKLLQKAEILDPGSLSMLIMRADIAQRKGDVAGAEAAYLKALEKNQEAKEPLLALAVMTSQKKAAQAREYYNRAIAAGAQRDTVLEKRLGITSVDAPKNNEKTYTAEELLRLGDDAWDKKDYGKASEFYFRLVDLSPNNPDNWGRLAAVSFKTKNNREGIDSVVKLVELCGKDNKRARQIIQSLLLGNPQSKELNMFYARFMQKNFPAEQEDAVNAYQTARKNGAPADGELEKLLGASRK